MNETFPGEYRNEFSTYPWSPTTDPYQWQPSIKTIKRVTRTVDKYDSEGRFIGREIITEEYEDVEKQVWGSQEYWVSGVFDDMTGNYDQNQCLTNSATAGSVNLCIN